MNKLIITVLGKDRPGIISKVSAILYENNCNLENVNQMILQNQFAGFFFVEPPSGVTRNQLQKIFLERTGDSGLTIHVSSLGTNGSPEEESPTEIFLITTIGPDQKGLVARFSSIIASFNANIINLKAVFKGGSDPNANVMSYQVAISSDVDASAMFKALKEKACELNLDIRIQHKNIFDAINKI
ncbi:MAG: amino acid-binding protein [Deltaproteobacteria bacterium]|nr:MAG: amino acid-binding protein [Deltaproteobacteria bacterium]